MTNDLVAQVQNLSQRVNILEKEKGAAESALMAATESNKKAMDDKCKEVDSLRAKIMQLQGREKNQAAVLRTAMKKIRQTANFGELCVKLSTAATGIGKHTALVNMMNNCPQLRLRKKELGWDPYAEIRANKLQQQVLKGEYDFKFLTEVEKLKQPLTPELLESLEEDYDVDLDHEWGETPEDYPCEDEDVPILVPESTESLQNQASV